MLELGKEQVVTAGGKRWTLSRLTVAAIHGWRDWVAGQVGDPFADLERFADRLSPQDFKAEFDAARLVKQELQNFSLSCPLARKFLASELGVSALFHQLLLPAHPDATPDDAFAVVQVLGAGAAKALAAAAGNVSGNAPAPGGA